MIQPRRKLNLKNLAQLVLRKNPISNLIHNDATDRKKRFWALLSLVVAGECIFLLAFVLPRLFRPTVLAVFNIDNFQLGSFYSAYGFVAVGAYLLGGPIADRFNPAKLMSFALVCTGLGGLYLMTVPSTTEMIILYSFWGLTTILLFWAALMRTTRMVGRRDNQGVTFGILDGGRGLLSALVATISVYIFSFFIESDINEVTDIEREMAFQKVVIFFTVMTLLGGLLVRVALRSFSDSDQTRESTLSWIKIKRVLKRPNVWLQSIIIICAYCGYKVTDDFSLMAKDILGYDEVKAAGVGSMSLWIRPIAAIGAGLLADKISISRMTQFSFVVVLLGSLVIGSGFYGQSVAFWIFLAIVTTSLGVYALRGLYFAIMEEAKIPLGITGTVVGVVSIVGYLPDIFMGPVMGIILDSSPGPLGHQYVFLMISFISLIGLITVTVFRRRNMPE